MICISCLITFVVQVVGGQHDSFELWTRYPKDQQKLSNLLKIKLDIVIFCDVQFNVCCSSCRCWTSTAFSSWNTKSKGRHNVHVNWKMMRNLQQIVSIVSVCSNGFDANISFFIFVGKQLAPVQFHTLAQTKWLPIWHLRVRNSMELFLSFTEWRNRVSFRQN